MAHIPAPLLALAKLRAETCDVTFGTREHQQTPPHSHPTTNHVLVSEGTLYLTLEGVETPVRAGDWCTIPAGAEHAERFEEATSVVVFWVKQV
jgi:quercetin dioxygenase-like cupin family protein